MRPVKDLDLCEAVAPLYLASIAIRIEVTGSPLKRPLFSGFGLDSILSRHLPTGNPSYLLLWRTDVHRV